MARDPENSEAKSKLKFFKSAKTQNEQPAPEGAEPSAEKTQAAAVTADAAGSPDAPAEAASAEAAQPEQPEAPTAGKRAPKRAQMNLGGVLASSLALAVRALVILAVISAGAVVAALVVAKVIGPMVAKAQVAEVRKQIEQITVTAGGETAKETAKSGGGGHKAKGGHGGGGGGGGMATEIKDLVVNPAESDGTRYVCTTVSLEASTAEAAQEVAARESQVRDALIEILGSRTVSELSSLTVREEIKEEIRQSVDGLISQGKIEAVYFANFVLQ